MRTTTMSSSALASRFAFLKEKTQKKPNATSTPLAPSSTSTKKANIDSLKEFYLKRWQNQENSRTSYSGTGTLSQSLPGRNFASAPRGSVMTSNRPRSEPIVETNVEDVEIMCSNCFTLMNVADAGSHARGCVSSAQKCGSIDEINNAKLEKLSEALLIKMEKETGSQINHVRHLTQLQYHLDTARKWVRNCSELGALSEHTLRQIGQLTSTARHLAPDLFAFSKRVETAVAEKEKNLRYVAPVQQASVSYVADDAEGRKGMGMEIKSIVSEMDSDCGTQYSETFITQDTSGHADVADMQSAAELLRLKDEDEQRRWFYSQCLTIKLGCQNKARARRILISDLYTQVKQNKVPVEQWVQWIKDALSVNDSAPGRMDGANSRGGIGMEGTTRTNFVGASLQRHQQQPDFRQLDGRRQSETSLSQKKLGANAANSRFDSSTQASSGR